MKRKEACSIQTFQTGVISASSSCLRLQTLFLFLGAALLVVGLASGIEAQGLGVGRIHQIDFNDDRLGQAINALFAYIEGTFGALVMVCAGIGAIMSSAFGQYRASLGLLVVAVGSFILRSLVGTFFNDDSIHG